MSVKKSPWIMHYDATSCNGCDIEVLACLTPLYDEFIAEVNNRSLYSSALNGIKDQPCRVVLASD